MGMSPRLLYRTTRSIYFYYGTRGCIYISDFACLLFRKLVNNLPVERESDILFDAVDT